MLQRSCYLILVFMPFIKKNCNESSFQFFRQYHKYSNKAMIKTLFHYPPPDTENTAMTTQLWAQYNMKMYDICYKF